MLPGECGHDGTKCPDCGKVLVLQVLSSAAGYYLGTFCCCGPYSRESEYFPTRERAQAALRLEREEWGRG